MVDRDDEALDTESPEVGKMLFGEPIKKLKKARPKEKAKVKKKSDESSSKSQGAQSSLPLSMQAMSEDDKALYEQKVAGNKNAPSAAKPYKITEKYKVGEYVSHKIFGLGLVQAEAGFQKVEILFKAGRKLMVSGNDKK